VAELVDALGIKPSVTGSNPVLTPNNKIGMKKLSKKTIQSNQLVEVVSASYKLPTMKNSPWYKPETELKGYSDICSLTNYVVIGVGEKLEIIGLLPLPIRGVKYKRAFDGKEYSSYLGEFTTFVRLV
jgi:hypothetical protein